jgi:hypothetical protein
MAWYHSVKPLGHLPSGAGPHDETNCCCSPEQTQHGLHLRGAEVSDHFHASADLTLWTKHPSVPMLVIQPELRYKIGNDCGRNVKSQ